MNAYELLDEADACLKRASALLSETPPVSEAHDVLLDVALDGGGKEAAEAAVVAWCKRHQEKLDAALEEIAVANALREQAHAERMEIERKQP